MSAPTFDNCLLVLVVALANFGSISAVLLPNVLWDRYNPIFDNVTCPLGNRIKVRIDDKINVVCPNKANNPVVLNDIPNAEGLYNNLFITEDVQAFESCDATNAKRLLSCGEPNKLIYYNFMFRRIAPSESSRVYEEGKKYYIFATADGSSSGQSKTSGGFCLTHGLKMEIYVCKSDENCEDTFKKCDVHTGGGHVLSYRGEDKTFSDKLQDASVISCLVGFLLVGLFIGIVVGFGLNRIKKNRDADSQRCLSRSSSRAKSPNSTSCDVDSNENCSSRTNMV